MSPQEAASPVTPQGLSDALASFADRLRPVALDASLAHALGQLCDRGLDRLPLPGQGNTLQRWQALATVAGQDLALVKLFEGHTDALAILSECGAADLAGEGCWGVWAAEPPAMRARVLARDGQQVTLGGVKAWCSGALQVQRALITAWDGDQTQLVAIDLNATGQRIVSDDWQAVGMGATASVSVYLDHAQGTAVGECGEYLSRPGFWHGGGGIAACWYGAACALAEVLRRHCSRAHADPHALAHLGTVDAALLGAGSALRECAAWIDAHPQADASLPVQRLRAHVEQAVECVVRHVGRALGATPFCRDPHFARLSADLPVFIRQSHAERDLAALGQRLAQQPAGAWTL